MKEDIRKIRMRQKWLGIYTETGSVTKTALRCGIARSTLYRWINREKEQGKSKLSDKSKRPSRLANMKVTPGIETIILNLRETRKWGAQRIANYLLRKRIKLSAMTVWRVLKRHQVKAVVKRRKKSDYIRYSKEIPGERIQLDVMKVRNGAYQFTAIDDCTRLRTIRVYPNKKAESTIHFLGEILNTFPFPVQRIQTDWGTEFFNYDFQYELHDHFIKFRPIKPRTPHLNGKVERSQQTDKTEFWNFIDFVADRDPFDDPVHHILEQSGHLGTAGETNASAKLARFVDPHLDRATDLAVHRVRIMTVQKRKPLICAVHSNGGCFADQHFVVVFVPAEARNHFFGRANDIYLAGLLVDGRRLHERPPVQHAHGAVIRFLFCHCYFLFGRP